MNKQETQKILTILKANYPQSFKDWTREQSELYLDLWTEAFKSDDVRVVAGAVKKIIYTDTREFHPNIARVKKEVYKITNDNVLSKTEAWDIVLKALKESRWDSEGEFEKLPPLIQKAVGSSEKLNEWAWIESAETLNGVIMTRFNKDYEQVENEEFVAHALPFGFIEGIETLKGQLQIENNNKR